MFVFVTRQWCQYVLLVFNDWVDRLRKKRRQGWLRCKLMEQFHHYISPTVYELNAQNELKTNWIPLRSANIPSCMFNELYAHTHMHDTFFSPSFETFRNANLSTSIVDHVSWARFPLYIDIHRLTVPLVFTCFSFRFLSTLCILIIVLRCEVIWDTKTRGD